MAVHQKSENALILCLICARFSSVIMRIGFFPGEWSLGLVLFYGVTKEALDDWRWSLAWGLVELFIGVGI